MDLATEFSAQFEQDLLHRKFIQTVRIIFYTALVGVFGLAFISDGGNDARFLPYFLLSAFVALSCEMLATAKRLKRGALISAGVLLFVPWIALQTIDALWLSPAPGNAVLALGMSLVPISLFFIAQQRSRSSGAQTRLLVATLVLLIVGLVVGIAYQIQLTEDFSGTLTMKIFAGYLSDPVAAGGVALLIFFASLAFAFRRGKDTRNRMFALYTGLLAFCLILLTRNTGVWLSLLVGCIVFASLQIHKKTIRATIIVLLACGIAVAPIFSEMPFKMPPAIASVQKNETAKTETTLSRTELQKIAFSVFREHPVLGSGSASFPTDFRKHASPKWQIFPATSNNLYSFVLAENGIVGFLLLFAPAGFIFFRGVRFCLSLPHGHKRRSAHQDGEEKFHNSNTRSLLASLLGGIAGTAVLVGFDYSPSFLPIILGVAIFGGTVMHEIQLAGFNPICHGKPKHRKLAFAAAALVPAGLTAIFTPASYSAAQCEIGKRTLAPFLQNFYGNTKLTTEHFDAVGIETPLLKAVSAQPDNAQAWIELAQLYALSAYVTPESVNGLSRAMHRAAKQAVDAAPELAEAHLYKAVAEIILGEKDAARESLKHAETLAPNDLPLLFQITEAHRMLSIRKTPPADILKRLMQIAPTSSRVRQMTSVVDLTKQSLETGNKNSEEADASLQSLFEI